MTSEDRCGRSQRRGRAPLTMRPKNINRKGSLFWVSSQHSNPKTNQNEAKKVPQRKLSVQKHMLFIQCISKKTVPWCIDMDTFWDQLYHRSPGLHFSHIFPSFGSSWWSLPQLWFWEALWGAQSVGDDQSKLLHMAFKLALMAPSAPSWPGKWTIRPPIGSQRPEFGIWEEHKWNSTTHMIFSPHGKAFL